MGLTKVYNFAPPSYYYRFIFTVYRNRQSKYLSVLSLITVWITLVIGSEWEFYVYSNGLPRISELCEDIVVVFLKLLCQAGRICHTAGGRHGKDQARPTGGFAGSELPVWCLCLSLPAPSHLQSPSLAVSPAGALHFSHPCLPHLIFVAGGICIGSTGNNRRFHNLVIVKTTFCGNVHLLRVLPKESFFKKH